MERFRNLDWHPALEDMIDNVFIRDERMERESAMYRIMTDNFSDPFANIEDDYADVNIELIKKYLCEDDEALTDMTDESADNSSMEKYKRTYVPGIRKVLFSFPRKSRLDKTQHAMCLRVLLRLSDNENKKLNEEEQKEFNQYMAFQEIISEEQKEYLEFVKTKWDTTYKWSIKCKEFVVLKWKTKMQRFQQLPKYYVESINIPLSVQNTNYKIKDIKVRCTSCLHQGSFSKVKLPKLDQPCRLSVDCPKLQERYPPCIAPDKVTRHFRLPVSEDTYCESLATEAEADFVISSSGLKCLLSNVSPDHSDSWLVSVVVKSHNGKNIVYINKRLPPATATVLQKNTWLYKYILRYFFVDSENESEKTQEGKLEKAANYLDGNDSDSSNDYLKVYEEDLYLSTDDIDSGKSNDLASGKTDPKIDEQQNVSYNLFTIGPAESPKHEQIKYGVNVYKMLVRTRTDGIEILPDKKSQPLILAPKMEHQLELGAEAVTLEEGLHQWASLKFRPNTSLARVRIATDTSEVIQIERHTEMSLSNEMKRLYNVKVEDSLCILHNIIEGLLSLTPGQYIMQHAPQNGPFAYVFKHTTENRKNIFDLHTVCQSKFETITKTPWPPIDNMMATPTLKCFRRMPAMFYPISPQKFVPGRPRGRPKKNASVTNNQVPGTPRRSVRLQKTNTS